MVKEAIFNAVSAVLEGAVVIDLCAGSGALGIEALSRGAARAHFVDQGDRQVATIRRNLERLGYEDRATVDRADAARWLEAHPAEVGEADLVLLDPPYADAVVDRVLAGLDHMVPDRAVVVVEHEQGRVLPPLERLAEVRRRRYGDSEVSLMEVREEDE
jgi:16S rRNA (guanine(966)-N(2))-methyltransferase RsmD